MTFLPPLPGPINQYDLMMAQFAFEAHSELLRLMISKPELRDNPVWTMLRQEAYEMLETTFGGGQP